MKTKILSIHCNYAKSCVRGYCLNIIKWAMLLLDKSYGFVKVIFSVSINIVKNFKHNYTMKLFVVWKK